MQPGMDVFFVLMGATMVLAMHAGFAFLEVGTVRRKNQVNALVKIITDFAMSTVVYFFIGYGVAYGVNFFASADVLTGAAEGSPFAANGFDLVKFFFLLTFAAAIPAIISGGIAERVRFVPQLIATAVLVAFVYPLFEGMVWGSTFGFQDWIKSIAGAPFHDFAGSVVVHAMGGWLALGAVIMLGARRGRYHKDGSLVGIAPSSIPFLALGSWILVVGWFGFNVMSAQRLEGISGLVAVNSLMALAGFNMCQERWKIDDVLGVWPLHGMCGLWGGIAAGIFGLEALGGLGGVTFAAQLLGSLIGIAFATVGGFVVYGAIKFTIGLRLGQEEEFNGADLSLHHISAYPESDTHA